MNMQQQQQQRSARRLGRGPSARAAPKLRRAGSSGPSAAAEGDAAAAGGATAPAARGGKTRPSKLRASRERRQRQRERSLDADELEQRFGRASLSRSAPVFVPASQRGGSDASGASSSTSTAPGAQTATATATATATPPTRSLAFVTERNPSKRVSAAPPSRAARRGRGAARGASTANARAHRTTNTASTSTPSASDAPRRTRMGAKGSSALRRHQDQHQRQTRKLSLSGSELDELEAREAAAHDGDASSTSSGSDEAFPRPARAASAFPQQLSLFSQQTRVPQRVASRAQVIDTVFTALFVTPQRRRGRHARARASAFGDDTASDSDEPNEEFVKRGLAAALFQDHATATATATATAALSAETAASPAAAADHLLTPAFAHALVTALRFEDFRTASARLDILRAIHKSCATKRLLLTRALADATALRLEYVQAVARRAAQLGVDKSSAAVVTQHTHDHGHGFTELLRYCIEHAEESLLGVPAPDGSALARHEAQQQEELRRNCLASLVALWRAHWVDPAGSDDEELISCAGQFVAYVPGVTRPLLRRLLRAWPRRFPKHEVAAVRMVARVIMSAPPLHQVDATCELQRRVFARLAIALQSPHVDVAKEALAFTGCHFALVHFLGRDEAVYRAVSEALHANTQRHWHDGVRKTSAAKLDAALDFAP